MTGGDDLWAGYVEVPLEPPQADNFLPPAGTVAGRLARWPVPVPPTMAGLAFQYDAFVQGLPVPAERLAFVNLRAAAYWRMREWLDPELGFNLALPPGREVLAELCAPRYKMTTAGIQLEAKDEVKKRLSRSPDVGDALVMSLFSAPPSRGTVDLRVSG